MNCLHPFKASLGRSYWSLNLRPLFRYEKIFLALHSLQMGSDLLGVSGGGGGLRDEQVGWGPAAPEESEPHVLFAVSATTQPNVRQPATSPLTFTTAEHIFQVLQALSGVIP